MSDKAIGRRSFIALAAVCALSMAGLSGCAGGDAFAGSQEREVFVYAREDGSGTRGAFVEIFDLEETGDDGTKIDTTTLTAAITNSTAVMMNSIANDPDGIGYISLGSLNDTVRAVAIDGVEATAANVKDGSYRVSRPFNAVVADELSPQAQDFLTFVMSAEGQAIVEDSGYIAVTDDALPFETTGAAGKVVIAGSSSVAPVMEKLAEAYAEINPAASVEVQQSDSTTGVNMAVEGTADIGMASRELKESETSAGVGSMPIAIDGIAVIVSPDAGIDGLTSEQVHDIFDGTVRRWSEVIG